MTAFCEDCPIKGECLGEIAGRTSTDTTALNHSEYRQVYDVDGGKSPLFVMSENDPPISDTVSRCPGTIERTKAFGRVEKMCGALGGTSIASDRKAASIERRFSKSLEY